MKCKIGHFVTTKRKTPKTGTVTAVYDSEKAAQVMCSQSCKYYTVSYSEIVQTLSLDTAKRIYTGAHFPPLSAYADYVATNKKRVVRAKKA